MWQDADYYTASSIGQAHIPEQSNNELSWKDEEVHERNFLLYTVPHLPVNLWG